MEEVKICQRCGKVFYPTGPRQKYCSAACRNQFNSNKSYHRKTGKETGSAYCAYCGKLFYQSRSNQKYCSKTCQNRAKQHATRERVTRVCPICGSSFTTSRNEKYCSGNCRKKAHESYEYQKTCVICGRNFETNWREAQTCSTECKNRLLTVSRIARKQEAQREFYPGTIALIHKWFAGGDTIEEIMELTQRSRDRILEALATPLTPLEEENLEKGIPYRNRKRGVLYLSSPKK